MTSPCMGVYCAYAAHVYQYEAEMQLQSDQSYYTMQCSAAIDLSKSFRITWQVDLTTPKLIMQKWGIF